MNMMNRTPDDARAEVVRLAAEMDEDVSKITVREIDWTTYLRRGVLMDLHIERWRARAQITLEDVGIRPETAEERRSIEAVLTLGYRHLLPKEVMKQAARIDRRGRTLRDMYSLPTAWGRFIPAARYPEWRDANAVIMAEYFRLRDRIVDSYDDLRRRMQVDYIGVGRMNYRRLREAGYAPAETETVWVANFVERALARLETPEAIRESYIWKWTTTYVPLTPDLIALAERGEAASDVLTRDLARTARQTVADGAAGFGADLLAEIRGLVYDAALDCLEALRKNGGKLPRNSSAQLGRVMAAVERLKFWPDRELDARIEEIRAMLGTKAAQRSPDDVREILRTVAAESRAILLEVDRPPERSGRDLGVPDDLADLIIPPARTARGVDLDDLDGDEYEDYRFPIALGF